MVLEGCNGIRYVHSSYRELYSAGAKDFALLMIKEIMAIVVLRPKIIFFY